MIQARPEYRRVLLDVVCIHFKCTIALRAHHQTLGWTHMPDTMYMNRRGYRP